MAITPFEENLNIISALPELPNDVGGLSAAEFQAKFDEAGNKIKLYLNNTLITELNALNLPAAVHFATDNLTYLKIDSAENVLMMSSDGESWVYVPCLGQPGPAGPAPYDIAVENGYEGTEEEYNAAMPLVAEIGSKATATANLETESEIADADYIPFRDESASADKRSTWGNIKNKIKTFLDTVYAPLAHASRHAYGSADAITVTGNMIQDNAVTPEKSALGVLPYKTSVTLDTSWSGSDPYTHAVSITGYTITANSKVDIQPDDTVLTRLEDDGVTSLRIDNTDGTLSAVARGGAPTASLTLQATVQEVKT